MSAATFRRLGKIEQARGAIQEAEVKDSANPAVWVQLGLYYMALDRNREALEAFQKALFISPDDIAASVHLCRIHLSTKSPTDAVDSNKVDLVAGLLGHVTRGPGWDVPEAWYYLAKAYGLQGRKDKERESLATALALSDRRSIRDIGRAVGWCL
jgi:tetratricopeptide (TPR) repeat protein